MGFSSFFYALNNTENLYNKKFSNDMQGFKEATDEICSMNIQEVI
jgi:hypothetical protein